MSLNQPSLLKNRQRNNLIAFEGFSAYLIGCSQPSVFSCFHSIAERGDRIQGELDASAKGARGKIESL